MPAPSSIQEFLELVRKSGVVDCKKLDAYLQRAGTGSTLPGEPAELARQLERDGVLTHFQAEQILQGKWRRFYIGKYKVLEKLGAGGMGSVYLCEHTLMRRRVAIKVLPTTKSEDSSSVDRFYREARAVAALDHPNIVRAYDIDQDDKLHFLVMEYVDGASLQEVVKKTGPMHANRAAHYIRQAALGLHHAHEIAGLVHRDIKPGNILVDRSGTVKVLDMGLARFFNDEDDLLTKKYDERVLGTADYLAPEQALDSHGVDIRADIYSLGATFYFCLTGRPPFAEGSVAQKLIWHQTRQPKAIATFRKDVPSDLAVVVTRMMAKDPAQRYQTPLDVYEGLVPWTRDPVPPPSDDEMPRFSPAAMGGGLTPDTALATPRPTVTGAPSASKSWQVAGTPTPQPPSSRQRGPIGESVSSDSAQGHDQAARRDGDSAVSAPPSPTAPGRTNRPRNAAGPENGTRASTRPKRKEPVTPAPELELPVEEAVEAEESDALHDTCPETAGLTARVDTASRSIRKTPRSGNKRTRPAPEGKPRRRRRLWLLLVGLLLIALLGAVVVVFLLHLA